jgi:hypothetical protein
VSWPISVGMRPAKKPTRHSRYLCWRPVAALSRGGRGDSFPNARTSDRVGAQDEAPQLVELSGLGGQPDCDTDKQGGKAQSCLWVANKPQNAGTSINLTV